MNDIGFLSTKAEPDVLYWNTVKHNVFEYYEYILCYVDDILCISHDLGIVLGQVIFKFNGDKVEYPEIYIGAQVRKMIVDGVEGW